MMTFLLTFRQLLSSCVFTWERRRRKSEREKQAEGEREGREKERKLSGVSYKGANPIIRALPLRPHKHNYLPKTSSPMILRVWVSLYELWRNN